jgi:hypothetical protein
MRHVFHPAKGDIGDTFSASPDDFAAWSLFSHDELAYQFIFSCQLLRIQQSVGLASESTIVCFCERDEIDRRARMPTAIAMASANID